MSNPSEVAEEQPRNALPMVLVALGAIMAVASAWGYKVLPELADYEKLLLSGGLVLGAGAGLLFKVAWWQRVLYIGTVILVAVWAFIPEFRPDFLSKLPF
jgi:hypothetical protein